MSKIILVFLVSVIIYGIILSYNDIQPTAIPATAGTSTVIQVDGIIATMYNALESQCDSDPLVTAGNYKINPEKASQHKWIALSRDLLKRWGGQFDYGDNVRVIGAGHKNGIYKVVDTMNKRFKNRMDFLETEGTKMYKYNNVKIIKMEL